MKERAFFKKTFGPAWFIGGIFVIFAGMAVVFKAFGVPFQDTLKFYGGGIFFVYIPGRSLGWILRLETSRTAGVALSFVLGMITSTVVYKFSLFFDFVPAFYIWTGFCAVYFFFRMVKHPPRRKDFSFRLSVEGLVFAAILLLVFIVLVCDNYRNGLEKPDGSVVLNMHYYDGFLRNAVIRELSHSVPPQMPFAAGFPLSYHYGMDLFTSLFYRQLHIGVLDLNHRLLMTFFFFLLPLTSFVFLRDYSRSKGAALLGTFLILFGSGGLAYVATCLLGINQWGNIFYSFYFFNITSLNSFLPGLSILLAGFFCLFKYIREHRIAWLFPAALILSIVLEFKMFFIGPIMGALFVTGIVLFFCSRDAYVLKAGFLTLAFALPLALAASLSNRGGLSVDISFRFVDWIPEILTQLKLKGLLRAWQGLFYQEKVAPLYLLFFPVTVLLCLAGSFGLSLMAVPSLVRDFFRPKKRGFDRFFMGVFIGGCVLFFFFVHVTLSGMVRNFTNIYVFLLGAVLLTAAWSDVLFRFVKNKRTAVRIGLIFLVIIVSLPNTVRFMYYKVRYPQPRSFSAEFREAAAWMNRHSSKDAVIIHPDYLRYSCYFTDRRVVLDDSAHSYLDWHLSDLQRRERRHDIQAFFNDAVLNANILKKYNVSHIWLMRDSGFLSKTEENRFLECYGLISKNRFLKVQRMLHLERIFQNKDHIIYQVHEVPSDKKDVFVVEQKENGRVFKKFTPKVPSGNAGSGIK
ncbi:MAG: hypothetical protein JXB26_06040 [Candidatus Aminicenantes bacterium]|nr:hypothetical protein [Candidatus Aminicenantes bacterium]